MLSLSSAGAKRAIALGRKILGEGAEVITVPRVALRCGVGSWGGVLRWDKTLCSSQRCGLGVGVECQVKRLTRRIS